MKIAAALLLIAGTALPAQTAADFKAANVSLHQTHLGLRKYPVFAQCEDADWPNTKECNTWARIGVGSYHAIEDQMEYGR